MKQTSDSDRSDDKRRVAQTAILRQQEADDGDAVLQFQSLTLDVVLAQLHLQQVVAHGHTSTHGHIHIFIDIAQQGIDSLDGLHLLLQRGQLPEILFGSLLHLVFGQLQLQAAHVLAHLGQFVAVDNLTTSKDGLHSHQRTDGAVLHHRDADGVAQGSQCFSRQHLCQSHPQFRRNHSRGVDVHLRHALVGIEPETRAADVGEILGKGLLALLLGSLDVAAGVAYGDVVVEGRVLELFQSVSLC